MSEKSAIEWTDSTFNPWIGCTKVSPACDHCYAERDFDIRRHVVQWGAGQARKRTSAANWKLPLRWNRNACWFIQCAECGWRGEHRGSLCGHCFGTNTVPARRRVFCASLADVFDNEVPAEWRWELFELIKQTPNLDWLLLTKRIGNAKTMMADALHLNPATQSGGRIWPLQNVWIGATICNQAEADRDIPKLLSVPARVRFLSIEPMMGPINLDAWPLYGEDERPLLHWIICGGESGPHARPMHPEWARSLRDQCAAAGTPFLFKQCGEWSPERDEDAPVGEFHKGTDWIDGCQCVEGDGPLFRIGKKAAGRLLDGVEHNGYPKVQP